MSVDHRRLDSLLLLLSWLENLERAQERLVHTHHRTSIVELSAIVGRREEGDELALGEELVPVLHNLMGAADEIHVVLLQEAGDNIGPECEGDTAVVLRPAGDVLIRVRPEQIAQQSTIRNLSTSVYRQMVTGLLKLTSVGRMTRLICSMELRSGLRPPCIVKIFSSMIAAIGKQLKQSVNVFHSLML